MTDEQWFGIQAYVTQRLDSEESFMIETMDLIARFELSRPFYREMVERAGQTVLAFCFRGDNYRDSDGDPSDLIEFYRRVERVAPGLDHHS